MLTPRRSISGVVSRVGVVRFSAAGDLDCAAAGATSTATRRAIVKVATAADSATTVEREVTVGVASRVNAEILSGLNEGERIVVGVKVPDAPRAAAQTKGATPALTPPGATGAMGGGFKR